MREKAGECGHRSINIMMGVFEGRKCETEVFSYEGPFGVGYMTAMVTDIGEGPSVLGKLKKIKGKSRDKKRKTESEYVKLARKAIEHYVKYGEKLKAENKSDTRKGVFVSIKKHGALRGCIGTIGPTTDCVESEIIENAVNAAVEDPRFPPVTEDELEDLTISVDLLSEPEKIGNTRQLDPTEYGVIVSKGIRRGLLLPNLEGVDSVEKQLEIACQKAGIDSGEEFEIERFRVERFT
jgi:AmmeMemoRadiSam system protein A